MGKLTSLSRQGIASSNDFSIWIGGRISNVKGCPPIDWWREKMAKKEFKSRRWT
jgi:hypothetical protein